MREQYRCGQHQRDKKAPYGKEHFDHRHMAAFL